MRFFPAAAVGFLAAAPFFAGDFFLARLAVGRYFFAGAFPQPPMNFRFPLLCEMLVEDA